jgi:hypothetical protein
MKSLKVYTLLVVVGLFFTIGCGGGGGSPAPVGTVDAKVDIGNLSYLLPSGIKVVEGTIVGANAKILTTQTKEDVAGFIQEISAPSASKNSGGSLSKIQATIADVEVALREADYTKSISMLSTQSFTLPYPFTVTQYSLVVDPSDQPLNLASKILDTISGGGVSGLPVADPTAPSETEYRFILLSGLYQGTTFYVAVVIPESKYAEYEIMINSIINAANIQPLGATLESATETFKTATAASKADFLFVVDDSGSMSDDQDALAKAAKDFTAEMKNSGISYRTAIITTGDGADDNVNGDAYSILRAHGIIENNDTLFEQQLVAGTNGSPTETGIWNAEQSLQSIALGNSKDGAITAMGMPQSGASLSVVIISDEESQYTSRSGYVPFDISQNIFLDRNIKVYSIISPDYNYATSGHFDEYNMSQYDDLSIVTHGMYSDIRNTDSSGNLDYSFIMEQIAKDVGGISSSFILANYAVSITEVKVDGVAVAADTQNGYTYVQASNSIVFHGTSIPNGGQTVTVTYKH